MTNAKIRRVMSTVIENIPFDIPVPDLESCALQESHRTVSQPTLSRTGHKYPFPVMSNEGNIPHISVHVVSKFLRGEFKSMFRKIIIVDCRFPYEFNGGHIKDAINIADACKLKPLFETADGSNAIIFHCEYSQTRGPTLASLFRNLDRKVNDNRYPGINFPHVFVMNKGYKEFHKRYPEHCLGGYIKMNDIRAREDGTLGHEQALFKDNLDKARIEFGLEVTEENMPNNGLERRKSVCYDQISPLVCRRREPRFNNRKVKIV